MSYSSAHVAASYDRTFSEGHLVELDSFYRWALDLLDPPAGSRLLDVACGEGMLVERACERGLEAHGTDLSPVAAARSAELAPGARMTVGNGEHLPYADDAFDFVTCLGSLEHYLDLWRGAQEIRRVLKPQGLAAIFLPNSYYLGDIIWHVLRRGRGPHHLQLVERFATSQEWAGFLRMMGLAPTRVRKYNLKFPRSKEDLRWYRRYPTKLLTLALAPFTPFHLSYSFMYLCRVSEPEPERNDGLPLVLRRPGRLA